MLSFTASLSPNSTAFALFVTEKYDYKDAKGILSKDITKKIDLFLKSLKEKGINLVNILDNVSNEYRK